MSEAARPRLSPGERAAVAVAAAVQFVVILDFMLLLPLGPDLVAPLAIPASALGLLAAAYTGAAALSGLVFAPLLDRFERRPALLVALVALSLASCVGALAWSGWSYAGSRMLAGLCGAPTSALVMALITDEVAAERRGRAVGLVFSANALTAVLGVPGCLWLASTFSWRLAVAVPGGLGLAIAVVGLAGLRRRRGPISAPAAAEMGAENGAAPGSASANGQGPGPGPGPRGRSLERLSHLLIFVAFASTVAFTANLSAYAQLNLGLARAALPGVYMLGGLAALVSMRLAGALVDRRGAFVVGTLAIVGLIVLLTLFAAIPSPVLGPIPAFIALMACVGGRNVSLRALTSHVPQPETRARFMSHQTTAQQLGAVSGALLGAAILSDGPGGALVGMPTLARMSIVAFVLVPVLLRLIEGRLGARPRAVRS